MTVLLGKDMKKKILMVLFGTAFVSAAWTYYKTDDPIAACNIFVERAEEVYNDCCKVIKHLWETF